MRPFVTRLQTASLAVFALAATPSVQAATIIKADNTNALNLATSWTTVAPTSADIAQWDSTVTAANTVALGANTAWAGIKILNPAGLVTFSTGSTLTLGTGGIDMGSATQNLTINPGVTLASGAQTWNVAAGKTLTLAAVPTRPAGGSLGGAAASTVGGSLNIGNTGTVKLGTAASALLVDAQGNPYATFGGDNWAALDATGTVISAAYATGTTFTSGANVNLNANASASGATPASVRFGNTSAAITITNSGTSTFRGVLVPSTSVGGAINGGFIRPNRVASGATAIAPFNIIQNSTIGDLTVGASIGDASSSTPVALVKGGVGKLILTGGNAYTGATFIDEGTLQVGAGSTSGSIGSTQTIYNNGVLALNRSDALSVNNVISGAGVVTQMGAGTTTLSGTNTYTGGTNFNAGTVSFSALANFGAGALTFNGGALSWNAVSVDISARTVTLGASGGTFNTNGNNVTLAGAIGNSGSGALTKTGAGVLTLSGANTYTGATNVNSGTVLIAGSVAGAVTVANTATLGGSGTIGGLTSVLSGGVIAPGNGVGTLSTASLTLSSGAVLNYEFETSPANDFLSVTASNGLTLNGGGFNLYQAGGTTAFNTTGTYSLIGFSGSLQGAGTSALSVLNPQPGKVYTFGATGSNVTLDIANSGLLASWTTNGSGSWASTSNWSGGSIPNGTSDSALFNTALTSPATVTLDGSKTVNGATFDSAQGYTIAQGSSGTLVLDNGASQANLIVTTGAHTVSAPVTLASNTVVSVAASQSFSLSGAIDGSGSLTKSGGGTLDLSGTSNTYSGGTAVTGGTLAFSGLNSLGSGSLSLDGASLRYNSGNTADISSRTVTFGALGVTIDTNGNDVAFANAVGNSGAGSLTKTGSGSLSLAAANTYAGNTTITGGTLGIAADSSLGGASGSLTFSPGAGNTSVLKLTTADTTLGVGRGLSITSGTALVDTNGFNLTVNGTVGGASGVLRKAGPGSLTLNGAGTQGSTVVDAGTLVLGSSGSSGLGSGSLTLNGTAGLALGARNLPNTLVVNGTNSLASGDSGGASAINTVTGSGTLNVSISGANVDLRGNLTGFTGTLAIVSATGNFRLNGSTGSSATAFDLGTGSMTVRSTASAITLGSLSGAAGSTLSGSGGGSTQAVAYTIGALNTDTTFAGLISNGAGAVSLTKTGSGTLTLSGNNTYGGGTTLNSGSLAAGSTTAFGTGNITVGSGTTLDLAGFAVTNSITNNGGTITGLNAATPITQTGGSVSGSIGSGTLNGTIAGNFAASGTIAGSPTFTGQVKGNGATFTGAVTFDNGSIHSPGNSPGLQTLSSATYNTGSTLEIEFVGNTLALRGTDFDGVDITGAGGLTIQSGAILKLIDLGSAIDYSVTAWDSVRSFTIVDNSGGGTTAGDFTLDTSLAGTFAGQGSWSLLTAQGAGGDTVLTWTPVPEPSTYAALAGLAALGLVWKRRRQAR